LSRYSTSGASCVIYSEQPVDVQVMR
jgi:hypothetical protein